MVGQLLGKSATQVFQARPHVGGALFFMQLFKNRNCLGNGRCLTMGESCRDFSIRLHGRKIGARHHVANHANQSHQAAIFYGVNAFHTRGVQCFDFAIGNRAAAAAEHPDVTAAALLQQLHHELEELDVPTLIGANRDRLRIFFNRGFDNFFHAAVVAKVNDFCTFLLQNPPHDVDRGIMSIEQRSRCYKT